MSCIAVRHRKVGNCLHKPFNSDLCTLHYNSMKAVGPKEWTMVQMIMRQDNETRAIKASTLDGDLIKEELAVLRIRHNAEYGRVKEMINNTPSSLADIEYDDKVTKKAVRRQREHEERFMNVQREVDPLHMQPWEQEYIRAFRAQNPVEFHEDNQNIHLAVTVNKVVKETIEKVIMIPVPAEYRWNTVTIAKTPGEIIAECKLSIAAGRLLMEKYTSDETIYDMVPGIYGKTLDSVWQYILSSSDKEMLIKTLKTELEDNIGMCAQGNLTRLCNVLQGYLTDMPKPPLAEVLGDLLPPLMNVSDLVVRREQAMQIMRTLNVSETDFEVWLEPLMN